MAAEAAIMASIRMTPLISADAWPSLADWYERAPGRPSFESAVSTWIPGAALQVLRTGGEAVWPEVASLLARA